MSFLPITPKTKVGALLDAYPELEETLIEIAPAFQKLKNPVLRRTVAKVATLQQAALTGNVPVNEIVRRLREVVGQDLTDEAGRADLSGEIPEPPPTEVENFEPVERLDAGPLIDRGDNPLTEVVARLKHMRSGEMLVVTAPFYPAPLIDTLRGMGYALWARKEGSDWTIWVTSAD